MSNAMIVRAWKDKAFRAELGGAAPAHPAGTGEVTFGLIDLNAFGTSPICTDGGRRCSDWGCD